MNKDLKLIIQIPCFNEEDILLTTLKELPMRLSGISKIETLIIDDGSNDKTVSLAQEFGVDHILSLKKHKGLACAFMAGLDASLGAGADIIVNTDGDNQYQAKDIVKLIEPILKGQADMVIGQREVQKIDDFSFTKKILQEIGSWVVRQLSGTKVKDATCGFRAFSREAALRLKVTSNYTYTLETIIQSGKKDIALSFVPIGRNKNLRKSRLISSTFNYIIRSAATIVRIYALYEPLKTFTIISSGIFSLGLILALRFLFFYFSGNGSGHIQSLILASILLIVGFQIAIIGLVADLIAANRRLLEDALYKIKKKELMI